MWQQAGLCSEVRRTHSCDLDGELSRRLAASPQRLVIDPVEGKYDGITFPRVAEISLLGALECGRVLCEAAVHGLLRPHYATAKASESKRKGSGRSKSSKGRKKIETSDVGHRYDFLVLQVGFPQFISELLPFVNANSHAIDQQIHARLACMLMLIRRIRNTVHCMYALTRPQRTRSDFTKNLDLCASARWRRSATRMICLW